MVSDNMPPNSAPSAHKNLGPTIPSRSSSISRTSNTTALEKQTPTPHHNSTPTHSTQPPHFSHDKLESILTSLNSSRAPERTQSPPGANMRSASCSRQSQNTLPESTQVQRWAGLTRSVCNWDGLRKDPDLWLQDGDCLVHLYEQGASRRGPSFCVPLRALRQKSCDGMLDSDYAQVGPTDSSESWKSLPVQSFGDLLRGSSFVELYIPAPGHASREEAFNWHVTTRNFFAYVLGQPLVGRHMGQAFVDLYERMELFRSGHVNNHQDFLTYAENQGYRDLVECTDYALASLFYAERYKLKDVWIDAFAHCVGMGDSISESPEYAPISRITKALITRAYLEVDIHLARVTRALSTFLRDDFSPTHLGLSQGARNHLNQFRQFLQQFYVKKFGYWPPLDNASPFPKALYKSMFYDFQNLYSLLVDTQSCNDIAAQGPASGGICVLQNVDYFNKRHKFTAQEHPLPILPKDVVSQKSTRSPSSVAHQKKTWDTAAVLLVATNKLDANVTNSKLVQAYLQFERTHATSSALREDKISLADARKIRWLLLYGTLQYLTSVLGAPSAVRDTESAEYPLCCLVAGQSSWNASTPLATPVRIPSTAPGANDDYFGGTQSPSIQPDCQREDYFAANDSGRRGNVESSASLKAHLPSRQSSTRSFASLASLSRRTSRRNSSTLNPPAHCAIIVHGYGDGLNQATKPGTTQTTSESDDAVKPPGSTTAEEPGATAKVITQSGVRSHTRNRTPLLDSSQLDQIIAGTSSEASNDFMSRSDSTSSVGSSVWTDGGSAASSKSSADMERQHVYKTSTAEHHGLLGGLVSVDGTRVSLDLPENRRSTVSPPHRDVHPLLREACVQEDGFVFDFGAQNPEVAEPTTDPAGLVGLAFSASPSPPLDKMSSPQTDAAPRRKSRSSDIFSGLITAPSDLFDRYNNAIKRLESSSINTTQYGDMSNGSKSDIQPPTVTKTSHATKMSSLRNRVWNDDGKKEKRMSLTWRR